MPKRLKGKKAKNVIISYLKAIKASNKGVKTEKLKGQQSKAKKGLIKSTVQKSKIKFYRCLKTSKSSKGQKRPKYRNGPKKSKLNFLTILLTSTADQKKAKKGC